jgi:uncharacterized protein YbjT (DUF2867 family)
MGFNSTATDGNTSIPMVATKDVAKIAAGHLANLDFEGKTVQAVMGPKNYTMSEFTGIIGEAIGNPDLAFVQLPTDQAKQAFLSNGFSEDFVDNLLEMGTAIKTGFMNFQKRDALATTPTTAEEFAAEVYAPIYSN